MRPTPPPALVRTRTFTPLDALRPRLALRNDLTASGSRAWITPGFGASTAYISLSPGLVCVFDSPECSGLTHQQIGKLGASAHMAWNAAARALRATAVRATGIEFHVRPASVALSPAAPEGVEVRGLDSPPASWLAHPLTFATINAHFAAVWDTQSPLTYYSRDQRELFVFTSPEDEVVALLGARGVLRYSLGFPLVVKQESAMAANL